jgi:hypothetical protein
MFDEAYMLMKVLTIQSSPVSYPSYLLGPNILLGTLFSDTVQDYRETIFFTDFTSLFSIHKLHTIKIFVTCML